jgi:hypothetical protein
MVDVFLMQALLKAVPGFSCPVTASVLPTRR